MPRKLTQQTTLAPAIDDLMTCTDCLMWLINGDATGLDHSHDMATSAARLAHIQRGERELLATYASVMVGDTSRDDEFSSTPCECCGTRLAGIRHHMVAYHRRG